MSSPINDHLLKHLAELARIELGSDEEKKLLHDLGKILEYFDELMALDTKDIVPMTGGTSLKSVFRDDEESSGTNLGEGKDQFPETQNGFLKIPPVFSADLPAEASAQTEGGSLPASQPGTSPGE